MKHKRNYTVITLLLIAFTLVACQNNSKEKSKEANEQTSSENRIVSLNGALSETIYALGKGDELVGRDVTSTYPDYVRDSVTDLGHVRSIGVESILSLKPDMILALEGDLGEDLENSLKNTGVDFHLFKQETSVEGAKNLIDEVGEYIGSGDAEDLHKKIDADLSKVKTFKKYPKVLFIYARGAGTLMVGGEDTSMHGIIELAGAKNAAEGVHGFKPLTEEALLAADPDAVLLFDTGLESMGGKKGLLKAIPALTQTKAGKNEAILTMDGGLLSEFGPRVGEASKTLNQLLAPYAK